MHQASGLYLSYGKYTTMSNTEVSNCVLCKWWCCCNIYLQLQYKIYLFCTTSLKSLRLRDLLTFGYLCLTLVTGPDWALVGLTGTYWPYWVR